MPALQQSTLAFIGGGNMASAIIGGLLSNSVPKSNITVSEPWEVNRNKLAATGVNTTTDNVVAGGSADLIIIAVKPQVTKGVCEELAKSWADRQSLPVIVSIAAGITLSSLQEWSTTPDGRRPHVVRVMPNTPALVAEGASGAFASADVSAEEKDLVNELLGSVSKATEWVDKEELLDVVTGLSGGFHLHLYSLSLLLLLVLTIQSANRIRPRILLRYGRAPRRKRHCPRSLKGTGYPPRDADLSRRRQDAGYLRRGARSITEERDQSQRDDFCGFADL
jgi:pyrroline-5-carboxylate reductase